MLERTCGRTLRSGHVAEEIEALGKPEKHEWVDRLAVLLAHLLRWRFQPELRGSSLRLIVERRRREVADHLDDSASLRVTREEAIAAAYRKARVEAEKVTGLPRSMFPVACPWTAGQITNEAFWPEG